MNSLIPDTDHHFALSILGGILQNLTKPSSGFCPVSLANREAVTVKGKFFFVGEKKFFLKGVSYGPFSCAAHGDPFLEKAMVEKDFVRIISQENKGLSVARNVGIAAATGDIIAYTDSDCVADPDWLTFLVATFLCSELSAVGGPNLSPPEDSFIPSCIAVSPGKPTHVLLSDDVAEHIAGCNMAFRREVLEEINGFDPIFHAAGDDVDLCWRLQDRGYTIGFSPSAIVWHFRRNTVDAYLKQQQGYGKAEALVYFKHPYRFNFLGQPTWLGRIYGDISSCLSFNQPTIYSGVFGSGLFQTLYGPPSSLFSYLPLTLEWNVVAGIFFVFGLLSTKSLWVGVAMFLCSVGWCVSGALKAPIEPRFRGVKARLLIAVLIYLGPLVRGIERYRWRDWVLSEVEPIFDNP